MLRRHMETLLFFILAKYTLTRSMVMISNYEVQTISLKVEAK